MSFVLCAFGVVLAIAIAAAAITRFLARGGLESKLLAWAELYLTQAAAVLPDEVAHDLLSEWQADVRTRSQERGALSAVRWARGIALEAAPAIRPRPDDRRRQVAIKTFALRLVGTGHGPFALAALFLILRTRVALLLSTDPLTVDTVAVSVALSLWILAEIGGTAFAFALVPRMTIIRPVWLMLRSSRSLLGLGVIAVALGIGAFGLTEEMINHTSTLWPTVAGPPSSQVPPPGSSPPSPASPVPAGSSPPSPSSPVPAGSSPPSPSSQVPPGSSPPSPASPVAAGSSPPSPASPVPGIVTFEGSWLAFGLGSSLFLTLVVGSAFGRLARQRLTLAHGW